MKPTHGLEKVKLYKKGATPQDENVFVAEDWGRVDGPAILLPARDTDIISVFVHGATKDVVRCKCDIPGKMILSGPGTLPPYAKAKNASVKNESRKTTTPAAVKK